MNIKRKFIKTVRIREDRAVTLKEKSFEISMKVGEIITEADLINYLIDRHLESITVTNKELSSAT